MTDASDLPSSPAALRNRAPIADMLRGVLPERGLLLEVASGTGEHAAFLAAAFPRLMIQPSDAEPAALRILAARRAAAGLFNLLPPVALDARAREWPVDSADALLCINMVHISPWAATLGLMRGAERLLPQGAPLCLYGPFLRDGVETAPSNIAFDHSLKARNPEWGLRRIEDVAEAARDHGLALEAVHDMPANNLTALFRRL
jgi:hypothetical protein